MDSLAAPKSPAVVTTCDGLLFKQLLAGALAWLEKNYKRVDQLNDTKTKALKLCLSSF